MNKIEFKPAVKVLLFVFLLFFSTTIGTLHRRLPYNFVLFYSFTFVLSIGIYIGLFATWTVSVYNRIMQRHVRTYLMLIGVNIIFWASVRAVKWAGFVKVALCDRLAWYMYYIPMVMIPLLFFFTALCVGEDEGYCPSKKWELLFIPAILLILLVLTNDFHMLVFNDFDLTIRPYGQKYSYGVGYYAIMAFILCTCIASMFLLVKKHSRSKALRKAARLPVLVIGGIVLYVLLYIQDPSYGIGYYFIDATIFGCAATVAFWEACIRTGLVHSNSCHKEFFEMATTNAQILTLEGDTVYSAENAQRLSRGDFERLKQNKKTDLDKNTLLHISPIKGGYVSWSSDVSGIKSAIEALERLNNSLNEEIDLLTYENEQKKETTRARKLGELQSILLAEALPYSEKIKNDVLTNQNVTEGEMKGILFETGIISTYLKRKVNLILTAQTEKCISTEELQRAFLEVFSLLKLYGKRCTVKINGKFNTSLEAALLCYDLFQKVIEWSRYEFDVLYVTMSDSKKQIVLTIDIAPCESLNLDEFKLFEKQKLSMQGGAIKISPEEEGCHFSLAIPNAKYM